MSYPPSVTYKDIVKALNASRSFYPNTDAIAYFRPNSLTIHFEQLVRKDYVPMQNGQITVASATNIQIFSHEITHWSDQVSTVWGQEYLLKLFDAYEAARINHEDSLYRLVELFDEERRILFPLYYRLVNPNSNPHDAHTPWRIEFSAGSEFTPDGHVNPARPIFFVNFSDHHAGALVARQPITVGALLETTATWAELRVGVATLALLPKDEGLVEQHVWKRRQLQTLYDRDFTVYTAPAHMLARLADTKELLKAYELGAVLANVSLNLTDKLFNQIIHPQEFAPFGERQSAFIQARNRGYVFAVLTQHSAGIDINSGVDRWLADILTRAGLPSYGEIMQSAYARLDELGRGISVRSPLDNIRDYILEIGRTRFLHLVENAFEDGSFDPLGDLGGPMPLMFDANGEMFSIGSEHLDPRRFDPEEMHFAELKLREFTNNFLQGCRGFEP